MALYYKLDPDNSIVYLCNTPKDEEYIQYSGGIIAGYYQFEIELVNDALILPSNCYRLFSSCTNTTFDVSKGDTSNVTDMHSMFSESSITSLDLHTFDVSHVTDMSEMFRSCTSLSTLNLSNGDIGNVDNFNAMFYGCTNLTTINVDYTYGNGTDMAKLGTTSSGMFYDCRKLPDYDPDYLLDISMANENKYFSLYIPLYWGINRNYRFDGGKEVSLSNSMHEDDSLYYDWREGTPGVSLYVHGSFKIMSVNTYRNERVILPPNCSGLFSNLKRLSTPNYRLYPGSIAYYKGSGGRQTIDYPDSTVCDDFYFDVSNFDTSHVKNMSNMFANSFGLFYESRKSSSGFDGYSFYVKRKFKITGLNTGDVSKVTDMSNMFSNINILNCSRGYDPFIENVSWRCDSLKTAENMFQGSSFVINNFNLDTSNNANNDINFNGVFKNFVSGYYNSIGHVGALYDGGLTWSNLNLVGLDLSNGKFSSNSSYSFIGMFRNTHTNKIVLGKNINNAVINNYQNNNAVNYMFHKEITTLLTKFVPGNGNQSEQLRDSYITEIVVPSYTDWGRDTTLDGYNMFLNASKLPNYDVSDVDIDRANTRAGFGYFGELPPEKMLSSYIKLPSGGKDSTLYIKDSEGVGKESEVYI